MKKLIIYALIFTALFIIASELTSAPTGWSYTRQINIVANSSAAIPSGYSFNITFNLNLSQLVNDGKLQADYDDFRVRINDTIDVPIRIDYTAGTSNFSLYFNLSNQILASQNYTDLDLFYGNPDAVRFSLHNNTRTLDYKFNDDGSMLINYPFDEVANISNVDATNDTANTFNQGIKHDIIGQGEAGIPLLNTSCKFGSCFNASNTQTSFHFRNATDLAIVENSPLTIDIWIGNITTATGEQVLFEFSDDTAPEDRDRIQFTRRTTLSQFEAIVFLDAEETRLSTNLSFLNNNELQHIRWIIYNNTNGIELYINQSLVNSSASNIALGDEHTSTRVLVGRLTGRWKSIIDDMYIWTSAVGSPLYLAGDKPSFALGAEGTPQNAPATPLLNIPINNTIFTRTDINYIFNWFNSTDFEGNVNYSIEIYNDTALTQIAFSNGSIIEQGINQTNTTIALNKLLHGDYFWRTIATDNTSLNSSYSEARYFQVINDEQRSENSTFNHTASEVSSQVFNTNIFYNQYLISDVSAVLNYNGTNYAATKTTDLNGTKNFTRTITIPATTIDYLDNFFWNFTLNWYNGTIMYNATGNYQQRVNYTNFTIRDSIVDAPYLNFIFKDETSSLNLSASVSESTFTYSPQPSLLQNKSFSYVNTTQNSFYNFSFRPAYQPMTAKITFTYESTNYPARTYQETLSLSNTTTTKTLFLLNTGNGTYTTFQVVNSADQPLQNVQITVTRLGNTIETKNTDAAGAATFFLDPDLTYTFTFTKTGYNTYTTSLTPTQSAYTITLESTTTINATAYLQGVTWFINPNQTVLNNNTVYNFTLDVKSNYRLLDLAGFILENGTGVFMNSTSCTGTSGCVASLYDNTDNHSSIKMDWFIVINGTYLNGTQSWYVQSTYEGRASFKRFFDDFDKLGSGFNDFTKAMFSFFFIFIITGTVSYVSGIYAPLAILGIIFASTAFLDVVGFIPQIGIVPHFITVLLGLIFFSYLIYEFTR